MSRSVLAQGEWSTNWQRAPFGRLVSRQRTVGRPDLTPLSVFLDEGVVPRSSREDNHNQLGADLSKYLVVHEGDIVFNKLRTWQGGFGVSRHTGIVSPAYFVCSPREGVDPGFLHYLLHSAPYLAELTRISKWMPPAQFDIAWEDLRDLPVAIPSLAVQRRITEYLHRATAHHDEAVAAARRRAELMRQRLEIAASTWLADARWPRVPLKSVASWREGPGVLSHDIRDEGVPLLRIVNLVDDTVRLEDLRYLDPVMVAGRWSHMRVRRGDLLVSGSATSGLPVVVPEQAEGAVPWTGLIRMWPSSSRLNREYLRIFLGSSLFLDQVNLLRTGIGLQHWGPSHLAQVRIPMPPSDNQLKMAERAASDRRATRTYEELEERQINVLLERRQALITAAVTGQIEIPGVAA